MSNEEYAWRQGFDRRMEVEEFGRGSFLASDLEPPYKRIEDPELWVAWIEGWMDAQNTLKAKAWGSTR